jgi:hypothetical protein
VTSFHAIYHQLSTNTRIRQLSEVQVIAFGARPSPIWQAEKQDACECRTSFPKANAVSAKRTDARSLGIRG